MARKRILMACPNYWTSPFQVGSHHLAREFVRAGWDVAFLSDPVTPWHLARGWTRELRQRLALWAMRGKCEFDRHLWAYVPASLIAGHNRPLLRSDAVHRHWYRWTMPNVITLVKERGFGAVDLLYIDSLSQTFWLDAIKYKRAIYRLTDYSPHFAKFTPATRLLEREMAQRVDLVTYPSHHLKSYVEDLGARRSLYFPNGVEYEHFARPHPYQPSEYQRISGRIAVYVGVILSWFHFEWLRQAARALPQVAFVLIGPDDLARKELQGLANVHLLGCRDYALVPAYLQQADVGLMPFDAAREPGTVECLNPLKLYQYLAAGLPVVASDWPALRQLNTPATLCRTAGEFIAAVARAASQRGDADGFRAFAQRSDWGGQLQKLMAALLGIDTAKPNQRERWAA